jgi:hypothetical protein
MGHRKSETDDREPDHSEVFDDIGRGIINAFTVERDTSLAKGGLPGSLDGDPATPDAPEQIRNVDPDDAID